MTTQTPRHLLGAHLPDAAGVLARAFRDDPVMAWVFSDDASREEDLATLFTMCATASMKRGHTYVLGAGGGCTGAALWAPPEVPVFDDAEAGGIVPLLLDRYGEDGLGRMGALSEAMGAHHPTDPHFYLFIVGIDPACQGQGLGVRLLAPVLDRCDHDGLPAYLESTNPRNIAFYERLGFRVHTEFHPDGGPLLTGMWRTPATH